LGLVAETGIIGNSLGGGVGAAVVDDVMSNPLVLPTIGFEKDIWP